MSGTEGRRINRRVGQLVFCVSGAEKQVCAIGRKGQRRILWQRRIADACMAGERDMGRKGTGIKRKLSLPERVDQRIMQREKRRLGMYVNDQNAILRLAKIAGIAQSEHRGAETGDGTAQNILRLRNAVLRHVAQKGKGNMMIRRRRVSAVDDFGCSLCTRERSGADFLGKCKTIKKTHENSLPGGLMREL